MNEQPGQRKCATRRRQARSGAARRVRRCVRWLFNVHDAWPRAEGASAFPHHDDGRALRKADQSLLQRQATHWPAWTVGQIQGRLSLRLPERVRGVVRHAGAPGSHPDVGLPESYLHRNGAHGGKGISSGADSWRTDLLSNSAAPRHQALKHSYLYLLLHLYLHLPKTLCGVHLSAGICSLAAHTAGWNLGNEFARGSRLGESQSLSTS